MVTVYAIRFESGETYIGITTDLERRLVEYGRRQSPSTKKFVGAFKLVYTKQFQDHVSARKHEKYMKSGAGRALLKSITT